DRLPVADHERIEGIVAVLFDGNTVLTLGESDTVFGHVAEPPDVGSLDVYQGRGGCALGPLYLHTHTVAKPHGGAAAGQDGARQSQERRQEEAGPRGAFHSHSIVAGGLLEMS